MPAPRPKKKFQRYDMNQTLIVAPDLRDWLPDDHLCYFVSEVVNDLDLASIYVRYD